MKNIMVFLTKIANIGDFVNESAQTFLNNIC